ncbi:MAG: glycoside hydrolase family 1 protein [bacterium]|nr:glycoside hydrolase family 1 protein [bacterium]MDZ4285495.1 glycoside hydrolase family 1 protein [Candidatus Sungbacteria bacterium]
MSTFPKDFLWGAATSSHQVEGNNHNDWSEWEKKNAERLAKEAEQKFGTFPSWPHIKEEAQKPENYISGIACDHYNRFKEDFDIAKQLGHNAHRFSIEWSRIEPEEGKFDDKEIEHYRDVIKALRERGLEPFVTLWHWTMPIWLAEKGGVGNRKFPFYFSRFCDRVVSAFGDEVRFYITLNEPDVFTLNSYLRGIWLPQKKSLWWYYRITANLIRAHRAAYSSIKKIKPKAQLGVSVSLTFFESSGGFINNIVTRILHYLRNIHFLRHIRSTQDFVGVNYYFHNMFRYGMNKNKNERVSDMGWELYPEGMYQVLKDAAQYKKAIYITENGLADMEDSQRAWFIREMLRQVSHAMQEGADIRGYFHWSLLDNFEWDKGFWPRFGLVDINRKTLERKIRPSAWEYKKIIEAGL